MASLLTLNYFSETLQWIKKMKGICGKMNTPLM